MFSIALTAAAVLATASQAVKTTDPHDSCGVPQWHSHDSCHNAAEHMHNAYFCSQSVGQLDQKLSKLEKECKLRDSKIAKLSSCGVAKTNWITPIEDNVEATLQAINALQPESDNQQTEIEDLKQECQDLTDTVNALLTQVALLEAIVTYA